MKRVGLILMCCALAVALTATAALASGSTGRATASAHRSVIAVQGTIESVDPSNDSFTADASVQGDDAQGDDNDDQGDGTSATSGTSTTSSEADDQGEDTASTSDTSSSDDQGEDTASTTDTSSSDDQGEDSDAQGDESDQGSDDAATPQTITTGSGTTMQVDGEHAAFSRLHRGEHFVALYRGTTGESLHKLVAGRPLAVYARHSSRHRQVSRTRK